MDGSEMGMRVVLEGPTNYLQWLASFRSVARDAELYDLFTGAEALIEEPDPEYFVNMVTCSSPDCKHIKGCCNQWQPTYLTATPPSKSRQTKAHKIVSKQEFLYKRASEKYEKQCARIKTAKQLVLCAVSNLLRPEIDGMNPKEAFDHLSTYRMDDEQAQQVALAELRRLHVADFKSLSDYIAKTKQLGEDIKESGGDFNERNMIAFVVTGLSPFYRRWTERYNRILADKTVPNPDLRTIITQLLAREKNLERVLPRCSFTECGKLGHKEEDCWIKDATKRPGPSAKGSKATLKAKSKSAERHLSSDKDSGLPTTDLLQF